ncbi:Calcium-transporting ATPase [Handroanthus impetiginosus]|uniref:Calcium-transporting ATPase n=1 Tax=Handroanthus impetiginosus TaxID=429701 RepID=A0A2G9HAE6_9LAMI|nr:Calcium-transporting ATPase [Handroanthus impetiginosus]
MWRNIMAQVAYQVIAISILQFQGPAVFGDDKKDTITFVMPMFLQVFNMINTRKIEEKNIFSGSAVVHLILAHYVDFVGLDWKQWILCIGISLVCWPVSFAVKFVPVGFFVSPFMLVHHKLEGMLRPL